VGALTAVTNACSRRNTPPSTGPSATAFVRLSAISRMESGRSAPTADAEEGCYSPNLMEWAEFGQPHGRTAATAIGPSIDPGGRPAPNVRAARWLSMTTGKTYGLRLPGKMNTT
jgi:hypothetical protein